MKKSVQLRQGVVEYQEFGSGAPIVFIHPLLTNGMFWHAFARRFAAHYRCIVPDLPLGAHSVPMPADADLTPPGIATLIGDFLDALDLQDLTLVGNDTGGGLAQVALVRYPQRIGRVVLLNCDAFEHFLPFPWSALQLLPHLPGGVTATMALLQWRPAQRFTFALLAHTRLTDAMGDATFTPAWRSRSVRRDLSKVLAGIHNRYTLDAARQFGAFQPPVLIVWGKDDFVFVQRDAERLRAAFPNATLERVAHSRAFVAFDQPDLLAERMTAFIRSTSTEHAPDPVR